MRLIKYSYIVVVELTEYEASGYIRVRIHNQNMTTAANAHADKKTLGHLS
jgi:hypothetical protein